MIELFLIFIFYYHYQIEEEHQSESLFLEMKNYSFNFEDVRFDMDIISNNNDTLYELMFDENSIYILVPLLNNNVDILKVYYPIEQYNILLTEIKTRIYWQFFVLTLVALFIAMLFSYYSLRPLRNALHLLEEFIKDIIHDLNTPISSILLNLKMMQKNNKSKRIEQSVKNISILHKNLDNYLRESKLDKQDILLKDIIEEQITFFKELYDYLHWHIDIDNMIVFSDKNALSRIIYNLISNACKYNIKDGNIHIVSTDNKLIIMNDSHGIKNPSKVFKRFYKEHERGLGIGLHIVEKLCKQLDIKKELHVEGNSITVMLYF